MLANGNVPISYKTLPGGWAGTDATVALMQQMATGKFGSRSPKIRALAINIVREAGVAPKDYVGEMVAIHNWVRDRCRYTRDVAGQETLCYPEEIAFNTMAGDCDDMSMLDAALLGAIGIATRFVTMGTTPLKFDHVYLQARPKDSWISLDPIMKKPAGWEAPPGITKVRKVFPENTPGEMRMSGLGGPHDWYVGYQGGGFSSSHLSPAPDPRASYGPGQGPLTPQADTPYVVMDSFLTQDAPIEQISRDMPAFPQQESPQTIRNDAEGGYQPTWRAAWERRARSRVDPRQVAARVRSEEDAKFMMEETAQDPLHGLNDVMLPDQLAALGYSTGIDRQQPLANMQRPVLAQAPEGIDAMFTRPNLVLRTDKGQTIVYNGLYSLAEKPPIRPYTGMAGLGHQRSGALPGMGRDPSGALPGMGAYIHQRSGALPGMGGVFGVGTGRRDMMPGMGSISGPGLAELSDLRADPVAASAPLPPPAIPMAAKVIALGAIAAGIYLLFKKKG